MNTPPPELLKQFESAGQRHVFDGWEGLSDTQQDSLVQQLKSLKLTELKELFANQSASFELPHRDRLKPIPNILPAEADPSVRAIGEAALKNGEVAVIVVAGGQGTRLGFDKPKGLFPVSPVSGFSLFQIHAEKVLARSKRHGVRIPFLIMTSDATHDETVAFFTENQFFGLPKDDVTFFQQGTMPALELKTGRLLLEGPGQLFCGPNGHGGTLTALADTGLLDRLIGNGIRHLFYFQVDNPLVKIADPGFIGQHIAAQSQVSSKAIPKDGPTDKLGNFLLIDGRLGMIEYSDLSTELAEERDEQGELRIRAGSPAIHIFDLAFLKQVTKAAATKMPYHLARKKVAYWDHEKQSVVEPTSENALKFERFIFDVLPHTERWAIVWTSRFEEFAPLKNATGADSPDAVRKAQSDLFAGWLRKAGATVAADATVEISPLVALESNDVKSCGGPGVSFQGQIVMR